MSDDLLETIRKTKKRYKKNIHLTWNGFTNEISGHSFRWIWRINYSQIFRANKHPSLQTFIGLFMVLVIGGRDYIIPKRRQGLYIPRKIIKKDENPLKHRSLQRSIL